MQTIKPEVICVSFHSILQCLIDLCISIPYRHLDLSQSSEIRGRSNEKNGLYEKPNQTLAAIVEHLPLLKGLDISGTNLAGTGKMIEVEFSEIHQNPFWNLLTQKLTQK